jgi:hypothetical protein
MTNAGGPSAARARLGRLPALVGLGWLALAVGGAGCSDDCCTFDSLPITLTWAPAGTIGGSNGGGLLAQAMAGSINGGLAFPMSVDTGAALTVFDGSADGTPETMTSSLEILDAAPPSAVRARFSGIDTLASPLGDVGDQSTHPLAVLGGDILSGFSTEFHFGVPSITFWANQRADDGFLEDAGYAVLHFTPFGGGEVTANGDPDIFGLRGPLEVVPTRIVFRTCAAPAAFDPATAPLVACCTEADAFAQATGVELALLLSTGTGPLVLSQTAWNKILPTLATPPAMTAGPLWIATASTPAGPPIDATWTTIPRLALVNQESSPTDDAGPCVDLARSRRLEQVSIAQANGPTCVSRAESICVQPCDIDPNNSGEARNSAAYIELGGQMAVAVVADDNAMLQGLRADIRPEGPEIDGIIGAGALGGTRLEIDYRSTSSMRAIFSCDGMPARDVCWTGARCPQLPDNDTCHLISRRYHRRGSGHRYRTRGSRWIHCGSHSATT